MKRFAGTGNILRMRRFLRRNTIRVEPKKRIRACRDPADDFILEIAVEGKADYLVTGDDDLLVLDPFQNVRIVTFKEFRGLFEKN